MAVATTSRGSPSAATSRALSTIRPTTRPRWPCTAIRTTRQALPRQRVTTTRRPTSAIRTQPTSVSQLLSKLSSSLLRTMSRSRRVVAGFVRARAETMSSGRTAMAVRSAASVMSNRTTPMTWLLWLPQLLRKPVRRIQRSRRMTVTCRRRGSAAAVGLRVAG